MTIRNLIAGAGIAALMAGPALAQSDYHGFDPDTVDALNERLETPLTSEALAVLADHTDIEACGGTNAVMPSAPEGWEDRLAVANEPGGDVVMPVPLTALSPDYPPLLEILGVEGVCEVMFDVTAAGDTGDVMTSCSLPQFAEATRNVIEPLEFEAADGQASPETGDILLPILYCRPDEEES